MNVRDTPPGTLSRFDAFPYLITRVVPSLYHINLLPAGVPELEDIARRQVAANQLPACLVLAHDRVLYLDPSNGRRVFSEPPSGGYVLTEKLAAVVDVNESDGNIPIRQIKLAQWIAQTPHSGYMLGDLTKGGRAATNAERQDLAGALSDGTPRGLTRCESCGDWKGVCLDPSEHFTGQVMTVHCFCDNHNRCARCHERLYERRLNANYYSPPDRGIWHVPGFCGFNHHCSVPRLSLVEAS